MHISAGSSARDHSRPDGHRVSDDGDGWRLGKHSGGRVGAAIVTLLKNTVQDYLPLLAKGASGQLEIVVFSASVHLFLQRARQGIVPLLARFLRSRNGPDRRPAAALPRREQPAAGTLSSRFEECNGASAVSLPSTTSASRSGPANPRTHRTERRGKSTIFQPPHRRAARKQRRDRVRGETDNARRAVPHRSCGASPALSST